jgi:hypothetical protein
LKETDWIRFDYYGSRIRRLGFDKRTAEPAVHKDIFTAWKEYAPTRPLLPNLRHIRINFGGKYAIPIPELFLSSNLRSVDIKIGSHSPENEFIKQLCPSILQKSPNIHHLSISNDYHSFCYEANGPLILPLIIGLSDLHTLSFDTLRLPQEALSHLARLPDLQVLHTVEVPPSDVQLFITSTGSFPSLTDFAVLLHDWSSAATMVQSMRSPIKALQIECVVGILPALNKFLVASISYPSFTSLSSIKLCSTVVTDPSHSDYTSKDVAMSLRPLLSCTTLRVLSLKFSFLYHLDDAWLMEAALGWPSLEELHIEQLMMDFHPKMTFSGLTSLIDALPGLESITLPLDTMTVLPPSTSSNVNTSNIQKISLQNPCPSSELTRDVLMAWKQTFPHLPNFAHFRNMVLWANSHPNSTIIL